MPDRLIRESWCSSEKIDLLTPFEETVFTRLIVNCDDYGRMDGRSAVLRSRLFVVKQNLAPGKIVSAVKRLEAVGLLRCYTVEDKPYIQLLGWGKHQRIRAQRSRYPEPPEQHIANTGVSTAYQSLPKAATPPAPPSRRQMSAADSGCNEIQSNPNLNPNQNPNPESNPSTPQDAAVGVAFSQFWKNYPRKVNKQGAYKVFTEIRGHLILDTLLQAIEQQKTSTMWTAEGGRFIPQPVKWLRDGRWEEEVIPPAPISHGHSLSDIDSRTYSEQQLRALIADPTAKYLEEDAG